MSGRPVLQFWQIPGLRLEAPSNIYRRNSHYLEISLIIRYNKAWRIISFIRRKITDYLKLFCWSVTIDPFNFYNQGWIYLIFVSPISFFIFLVTIVIALNNKNCMFKVLYAIKNFNLVFFSSAKWSKSANTTSRCTCAWP